MTENDGPPPSPVASLGSMLRQFFSRYRRIECSNGASYVDVAEIEPCPWAPEYIRLGPDDEHTHVMARPGDDAVSIIADDVEPKRMLLRRFPTIYH